MDRLIELRKFIDKDVRNWFEENYEKCKLDSWADGFASGVDKIYEKLEEFINN